MPQDPLAPGLRDELITGELADLLQAAADRTESRPLDPSEALERLGKHLLRVARRLRAPSDQEKVDETTALVNAAIEVLGEDLRGDQVEAPARILQGVRPTSGPARNSLPNHPMIPLTASELLVNGANEPSFGTVLLDELRCATEVDLICAFVGFTGFEPLKNEFRALVERGGRVRVITSTYAPGVFTRIQNTFDSYWHTAAFEPYRLEDRERLEAALSDAKGYAAAALSKQAQRTIDQYKHQLAEAYEQLHLLAKPHQQRVLDTLALRREVFDEHRHLVVAATGTGKTVVAALDYARLCQAGEARPRLLFVAHREQILMQALSTFRNALRDPPSGGALG